MTAPDPALPPPPCVPWDVVWPCDVTQADPVQVEAARAVAQHLLWAATGRRFGVCEVTRPVRVERRCGCAGVSTPTLIGGVWTNVSCDPCADDCCRLWLPARPVREVVDVLVDGVPLASGSYWWDDRSVRLVGGCWPSSWACEPDRITVTWRFGLDVPPCLPAALGELAAEVLADLECRPCRLPSRVTSITRQGVAMDLGDPSLFLADGLFGLPLVDGCIRALNPNGLTVPSRVLSPDLR